MDTSHHERSVAAAASFALILASGIAPALADNPIVQTIYTADPAPVVYGDTVYLYTSHDEDVTVDNFFTMNDWYVFSSKDMVNWTNHGSPLSYRSFSWATGKAWAPHGIERNGKYYLYVPVSNAIGVAVADSPIGPFEDAIGAPLMSNYQYIDPTVFIDDDGQAYLYFGNPRLWYVKLNDDMISYSGQITQVQQTAQGFGPRSGDPDRPTAYEEGPWFYERDDLYYMIYPGGPLPEFIAYSTSPGPTGPWSYAGVIMDSVSGHAFTNHPGIVDYKGHSYFFYHTQELSGGGGFKRSVAVEEFEYGADGSIPKINKTSEGPDAADQLNPFERVEGETIAWTGGVEIEDRSEGGRNVASIDDGDYIEVKSVDFLTGAVSFEASIASGGPGGRIDLRLDSENGTLIGSCDVSPTGGWQAWDRVSCGVSGAEGVHDLFLVFAGGGGPLFNLDSWQFTPKDPPPMGTGGTSGEGSGGTDALGAGGAIGSGGVAPGPAGAPSGSGGGPSGNGGALGVGAPMATGGGTATGGNGTSPDSNEGGCGCTTVSPSSQVPWTWIVLGSLGFGTHLRSRRRRRARWRAAR